MRLRVVSKIIKMVKVVFSDNTNPGLDNFRYHTKTDFNNYFLSRIYEKTELENNSTTSKRVFLHEVRQPFSLQDSRSIKTINTINKILIIKCCLSL